MVRMILIGAALVVMAVIALVELAWLAFSIAAAYLEKYEIKVEGKEGCKHGSIEYLQNREDIGRADE